MISLRMSNSPEYLGVWILFTKKPPDKLFKSFARRFAYNSFSVFIEKKHKMKISQSSLSLFSLFLNEQDLITCIYSILCLI